MLTKKQISYVAIYLLRVLTVHLLKMNGHFRHISNDSLNYTL